MESWIALGVVVLLAVLIGLYLWGSYKSLAALDARVDEAWRDITRQLGRRADILPTIVDAVRGYASHERAVFDRVEKASTETTAATDPADASAAEERLQGAIRSLFTVAEAYPQLQTSQDFLRLQGELVETEDRIQASRRFYNGGVRELNTKITQFPQRLFARRLGSGERQFFEVSSLASIAEPPRVQF